VCAAALAQTGQPYRWQLPQGFPIPLVPPGNPMSQEKVALGRRLFYETRLSVTGRYSCASCHEPARAFVDGRARARGATGQELAVSAMSLTNVAYNASYGWSHPQVRTLEAQLRQPLFNTHPIEIGLRGRENEVLRTLASDPGYRAAFALAFAASGPGGATPVTLAHLTQAIAAFERTLISGDSPFDHYVYRGEHAALNDAAKRGLALFYSARVGCAGCHGGFNFTGTWVDAAHPRARAAFARNGAGPVAMRVPTLRNIALTAPYMHDGRFATLDAVLDHYQRVGALRPAPDARLRPMHLSGDERRELLAFLGSLTDPGFARRDQTTDPGAALH
jgi:cytochrome c peroxidase